MDLKVFFGLNLKRYRKEKHLSQEQLSEKVDISVKHLSKIERGLTFLSADLLERLSLTLGVSVAALFCKNDEKIYDDNGGDFKMSDFEIATLDLEEKAAKGHFFQSQFQN
jgi:transcriptional regulator with XRE-family HTH domain